MSRWVAEAKEQQKQTGADAALHLRLALESDILAEIRESNAERKKGGAKAIHRLCQDAERRRARHSPRASLSHSDFG